MATDEGATHEPSTTQAGGGAAFGPEWMQADALTDKVIDTVDRVKEKTTDNAVLALRAIVFGIVVSVLAIAVLLLSVIMLVRFADAYLPIGSGVGDATWAAHGFVGICFSPRRLKHMASSASASAFSGSALGCRARVKADPRR